MDNADLYPDFRNINRGTGKPGRYVLWTKSHDPRTGLPIIQGGSPELGKATYRITGDDSSYIRTIDRSERRTKAFQRSVTSSFTGITRSGDTMSNRMRRKIGPGMSRAVKMGAAASGAALATFTGIAVNTAKEFDTTMRTMRAVAGVPGPQLEKLRKLAMKLGRDTVFSANEAARAMLELSKAGVGTGDIMGGALKNTLDLATAGELELADAARIAANNMNIFELSGKQSQIAVDALSGAANASSAGVYDLAEAMSNGGTVAKQLGLTVQETSAAMALFADAGVIGGEAGTGFKSMMLNMLTPTKKAGELMKKLNLDFFDARGNFIGLANMAGLLQEQLKGLTQEQRLTALSTIFGSYGQRGATLLMEAGRAETLRYTKATSNLGNAQRVGEERMGGFAGALETLKGSFETVALTAADRLLPTLNKLTRDVLVPLVNGFGRTAASIADAFIPILGDLVKAATPVMVLLGKEFARTIRLLMPGLRPFVKELGVALLESLRALLPVLPPLAKSLAVILKILAPYLPILTKLAIAWGAFKMAQIGVLGTVHQTGRALLRARTGLVMFAAGLKGVDIASIQGVPGTIGKIGAAMRWMGIQSMIAGKAMGRAFLFIGKAAWSFLASPLGLAIAAVVIAGILIWKNWDKVKAFLIATWNVIKTVAVAVWGALTTVFNMWWAVVGPLFKVGWALISGIFSAAFAIIKALVGTFVQVLVAYYKFLWRVISTVWKALWNAVVAVWRNVGAPVARFVVAVWRAGTAAIAKAWGWLGDRWSDMWNTVKSFWTGTVAPWWNKIVDFFHGLVKKIVGFFSSLAKGVADIWKGIVGSIITAANWVLNTIESWVNKVIDAINWIREKLPGDFTPMKAWHASPISNPYAGGEGGAAPRLARGTANFAGGPAIVGEQGRELVLLPKGSAVLPHGQTETLLGLMGRHGLPGFAQGANQQNFMKWMEKFSGGGGRLMQGIVAVGKWLQGMGYAVTGHSAFPPIGRHTAGSYHYRDQAIDVNAAAGTSAFEQRNLIGLAAKLRARVRGIVELLHPGNDPAHRDHLHLAMTGGGGVFASLGSFLKAAVGIAQTALGNVPRLMIPGALHGPASALDEQVRQGVQTLTNQAMRNAYQQINATMGAVTPHGSTSVAAWISAAAKIAGAPASWIPKLVALAMHESSGNPRAVNPTPVSSGEHAMGLMQTIPSTFRSYALPGYGSIFNPVHNAIAAIRYIRARYGEVPAPVGGYAQGGYVREDALARVHKREAILSAQRGPGRRSIQGAFEEAAGSVFGQDLRRMVDALEAIANGEEVIEVKIGDEAIARALKRRERRRERY